MGSEPHIKVTEEELEYRLKNHREIKEFASRQLSCCSCANVLSKESGRVQSHSIFGIIQCENCKSRTKSFKVADNEYERMKWCDVCSRKVISYLCNKKRCLYKTCKSCILRNSPQSLVDFESRRWKCFACNPRPLWKLRGACAAIMNPVTKRTESKKVKSTNESSESEESEDSEENTSDSKKISYVRRNQFEESKKLRNRLISVCDDDEDSSIEDDEPDTISDNGNKRENYHRSDVDSSRFGTKPNYVEKKSRLRKKSFSSSEYSDVEKLIVFESKNIPKNVRIATSRQSRTKNLRKRAALSSTSSSSEDEDDVVYDDDDDDKSNDDDDDETNDDENDSVISKRSNENVTKMSKNKKFDRKKDREEISTNESERSSRRTRGTTAETTSSVKNNRTNKKIVEKKKILSSDNESTSIGEISSDDSSMETKNETKTSSSTKKGKIVGPKRGAKSRQREESSDDEPKTLKKRNKIDDESTSLKSSKTSKTNAKTLKKILEKSETSEEDDKNRKIEKKSSGKSPGPKSFKERMKLRAEVVHDTEEDSDCSATTRSTRNKNKRKISTTSENDVTKITAKSIGNRLKNEHRQASDSSSGKEFKKTKVLRSSFVALKRMGEIDEDLTTSPKETENEENNETITKEQAFAFKNSVNNFYTELKNVVKNILNDIEIAQKRYRKKDSLRLEDADCIIIETEKVIDNLRNKAVDNHSKMIEHYDKWCKKTRVRNVFKRSSNDASKSSKSAISRSSEAATNRDSTDSENNSTVTKKIKTKIAESTIANGDDNVVSDCDSNAIFSGDETRTSNEKKRERSPTKILDDENSNESKNSKNSNPKRSSRDRTPDKIENSVISSDDERIRQQSPTMSQFSGRSSNDDESTSVSKKKSSNKTSLSKIDETANNENFPSDSDKDLFEESAEIHDPHQDSDANVDKDPEKSDNEKENSSDEAAKIDETEKITETAKSLNSDEETEITRDIEDSSPKSPSSATSEKSDVDAPSMEKLSEVRDDDEETENLEETSGKIVKQIAEITDEEIADEDKIVAEGENVEKPLEENTAVVGERRSEGENTGVDTASVSTLRLSRSSEKLTDGKSDDGDDRQRAVTPSSMAAEVADDVSDDDDDAAEAIVEDFAEEPKSPKQSEITENPENSEIAKNPEITKDSEDPEMAEDAEIPTEDTEIPGEDPKSPKMLGDTEVPSSPKRSESSEQPSDNEVQTSPKRSGRDSKQSSDTEELGNVKQGSDNEDANISKLSEIRKKSKSPKTTKKLNKTAKRRSSARRSSSDLALSDENDNSNVITPSKMSSGNESSASTDSVNRRAKEALLASSNSDDSTSDERESNSQSTPKDNNEVPPTPPESDSKSDKNLQETNSDERENLDKPRKKRNKFRLNDNVYYKTDEKLQRNCVVRVKKLKEKILRRYSRAIKQSKDYVESKNLERLVALDKLDKGSKKTTASSSSDEKKSSKELKRKKSRATKEKAETLLDHLNKVEQNDDVESNSDSDGNIEKAGGKDEGAGNSEERLLIEANKMAKKGLLESSDSGEEDEQQHSDAKEEEKLKKTKKVEKKEKPDKSSEEEEEKQKKRDKNRWRSNRVLTSKISNSDTEEEKEKFNESQEKLKKKKQKGSNSDSDEKPSAKKKKRVRRQVLHSDSDVKLSSEKSDSDSDSSKSSDAGKKKKKKKKAESSDDEKEKKKTRKRTRRGRKSSGSSDSLDDRPKTSRRKRIKTVGSDSDSENDKDGSPGKSGRKNIRKVIRDKQVADDTKQAAKEEEERLRRIAERQKLYNEMYEHRLAGEEKVDKLILDFDEETKEPLVSVDENLVKRLKPHQAQGIKFMWDACFESLERIKTSKGSGCILAHCMGLGKSFQVVTLSYTLLSHEATGVKTVLVVCPLSTVLNWANEFKIWLAEVDDSDDVEIYEMTKMKKNFERKHQLARWQETGGVMIIGYEMFRNLSQPKGKKVRKTIQETFLKCLVDPGPDLIVCDEGHLLKNEDTAVSKAMRRVKTLRRIVLTGTPLQNNLIEYHCMVQFVKPNLLGTKKEFTNRFENPITNGQFDDSTEYDVKLMKKRAHILHKLLEGSVQRFDYSVLTPFLPPKQEYVIFVKLTEVQVKMYRHYLDNYARKGRGVGGSLFADFQALQRIWTHPMVMQLNAEKVERANEKKRMDDSESEGSLKDFIDDESDTPSSSNSSDDGSANDKKKTTKSKRATRANPVAEEEPEEEEKPTEEIPVTDETKWWTQYVNDEDFEDLKSSSKLLILFRLIKESEQIGDKILVFSQSLYSLTLIERFLELIDEETQKGNQPDNLDGISGSWSLGLDYFRLDGQTTADNRRRWCDIFNRPTNTRARLFLISTRAGGLGINLTAANRVVIFDASWNPSHDVQSIFRIYRFGQKKPCYVYRLLAAGTMEEKIYNRQVTKLSLSCRVVDEQQIERHYSNNALAELYELELPSEEETTLALPKDRLLAEIFLEYKCVVERYHEHDSLLENQAGEELDEEERKQAWVEYEDEKKGKRMLPPPSMNPFLMNYQDPMMQHINMMNMGQQAAMSNPAMFADYQNLQRLMEKDFPGLPEAQQKAMASRAVFEMYNYVEKQAMAGHGAMHLPNLGGLQGAYGNPMQQSMSPAQAYMDIMRMQQQQQNLAQQNLAQQNLAQQNLAQQNLSHQNLAQQNQITYANNQQQLRADILRQQQQLQFAQQAQIRGQSPLAPAITIEDDDIMEVPTPADETPPPPEPEPNTSPKNKEE